MERQAPHWLKIIGYIFIAICVGVTGYSYYLSLSDQEDKELGEAYQDNLETLEVTATEGVHEIPDEDSAQETYEDSADAIPADANLGDDDLSREIVLETEDTEEGYGFENAVEYHEESDTTTVQ